MMRIPLNLGTRSDDLGNRSGSTWAPNRSEATTAGGQVVGLSDESVGASPFFLRMDGPRSVRT